MGLYLKNENIRKKLRKYIKDKVNKEIVEKAILPSK